MEPHEKFISNYQCKIEITTEQISVYEPFDVNYGPYAFSKHVEMKREHVVAIKMAERSYTKFMRDYQNYLDILEYRKNPVVNDMLDKLNTYIKLLK